LTLVASGSATLQVAAAGSPMVIMYQSNRIMWHLVGCWLIKTQFLSLVNILADRELVSEFMPYFSSIKPVFAKCNELLASRKKLAGINRELLEVIEPLVTGNASQTTAKIVLEMLSSKNS